MSAVFGPVPSRRLGRSLGIDPVPFKTCNWNCVYCQLGRTGPIKHQRREYLPTEQVLGEVRAALDQRGEDAIDWLTFVGSGEPTLHIDIGHMIRQVQAMADLPVAIITNGALLYRPDVRHDLLTADAVMPTVTAGTEELFLRLHRPARELGFNQFVGGLMAFRQAYRGQLWVEVMLLRGLNDTEEALAELAELMQQLAPDEIHPTLPTRPPNEPWVEPSDADGLARAVAILGEVGHVVAPAAVRAHPELSGDLADSIEAILERHPMRPEQLEHSFEACERAELRDALDQLRLEGRARLIERGENAYWTTTRARYVEPWPKRGANRRE